MAQGAGNISQQHVSGDAWRGSLSGTSLLSAAGRRTRWSIIIQAPIIIVLLLVLSDTAQSDPHRRPGSVADLRRRALPSMFGHIVSVARVHRGFILAMMVTFVATLLIPSPASSDARHVPEPPVLFVYRSSTDVRVMQVDRGMSGFAEVAPSPALASNASFSTFSHLWAVLLFLCRSKTLGQRLPSATDSRRAVAILWLEDVSRHWQHISRRRQFVCQPARANGGRLILTGVDLTCGNASSETAMLRKSVKKMSMLLATYSAIQHRTLSRPASYGLTPDRGWTNSVAQAAADAQSGLIQRIRPGKKCRCGLSTAVRPTLYSSSR